MQLDFIFFYFDGLIVFCCRLKIFPFLFRLNWYIKYPKGELRSDYYFMPFEKYLWLALLFIMIIATICLTIIQNRNPTKTRLFIDNIFLALESFCNQCGSDNIENISSRIICILLRATALTLIGVYGAIITSFLSVQIFQPPFTNKKEFLANKEYQFIILDEFFPSFRDILLVKRKTDFMFFLKR